MLAAFQGFPRLSQTFINLPFRDQCGRGVEPRKSIRHSRPSRDLLSKARWKVTRYYTDRISGIAYAYATMR